MADLGKLIFNIPMSIVSLFNKQWVFGHIGKDKDLLFQLLTDLN